MNLSEQSLLPKARPSVPVRLLSNWIEVFAVPIAISVMEAQPIIFLLALLSPPFTAGNLAMLLDEGSVIAFILGLQWWTMAVKYFTRHNPVAKRVYPLHLLGLVLAFSLMISTHLFLLHYYGGLIIVALLLIWCWKHAMDLTKWGLNEEPLVKSFKVSLAILLVGLAFVVILLSDLAPEITGAVLGTLGRVLPLFFLSGLIGLSFTRLGLIRKENARHSVTGSDPTRSWLLVLTLLWLGIVGAVIAFEVFSFSTILAVAPLFWNLLGSIVNAIFYVLYFILSPLFYLLSLFYGNMQLSGKPKAKSARATAPHYTPPPQLPAWAIIAGQVILLLITLTILFVIVRQILRSWQARQDETESDEEIREGLSMQAILRARRQERRRRNVEKTTVLDNLDPHSARAHYRELLEATAEDEKHLARQTDETPAEYQTRLTAALAKRTADPPLESGEPSDITILSELTLAYVKERYGGRHAQPQQAQFLHTWVPRLIGRLARKAENKHAETSSQEHTVTTVLGKWSD